ncbi:1720_t:CDS:2 [Paraglomus occultum]|uniref:1720_t:CDS:1 n=1 Tax=Paraglomus occultum TaxID=144539 RepID=A0A9N9C5U2_9GLOM|nr:1720_t:CDS:2 [Paraglomus occultum]
MGTPLSNGAFLVGGVLSGFGLLYTLYSVGRPSGTGSSHQQANANSQRGSSNSQQGVENPFDTDAPEAQNLLHLLNSIADDQARKEGYVHRGITCSHCRASPIRGIRYKCANCADYDLCESCEAHQVHLRTHTFLKIKIPIAPLANPRSALLNVFYPGRPLDLPALSRDKLRELQRKTHFDQVELEALYEQFRSIATVPKDGGGIDRKTFDQCLGPLGLEKNLITDRIFKFFDQDGNGIINFSELVCGLSILCKGNLEEKMKCAFKGYDLDDDGKISKQELQKIFKAYFHLSTELVRDVVKAMEEELMESYESSPAQPVAAAFNAAVPPDSNAHYTAVKTANLEDLPTIEWEPRVPVNECLSPEAIEELVEKVFQSVNTKGDNYIDWEEFRDYVQTDTSIVAWFEALGSVF